MNGASTPSTRGRRAKNNKNLGMLAIQKTNNPVTHFYTMVDELIKTVKSLRNEFFFFSPAAASFRPLLGDYCLSVLHGLCFPKFDLNVFVGGRAALLDGSQSKPCFGLCTNAIKEQSYPSPISIPLNTYYTSFILK